MKFLCDVHIPIKLSKFIDENGFTSIHVNNILERWNTKDEDIMKYADENDLILISKDSDFKSSFFINKSPKKLIKINLGNISNNELLDIFKTILPQIISLSLQNSYFIFEVNKNFTTITTN